MDLNQFLRERQPRWERLTAVLDRLDARGLAALTPHEADELFALYRLVSSDLNLVQTRTGNPALVGISRRAGRPGVCEPRGAKARPAAALLVARHALPVPGAPPRGKGACWR